MVKDQEKVVFLVVAVSFKKEELCVVFYVDLFMEVCVIKE